MAKSLEVVIGIEEVAAYFDELEDPRSEVNRKHPLVSVVTIAVMAVLAGADGPTAIARWARLKAEFLVRVLDLPHGVPRKDVFGRVLAALDPAAFQAGFEAWLESLRRQAEERADVPRPVLSIDGKSARRTHDRRHGLGALHSVSVWAGDFAYGSACSSAPAAQRPYPIDTLITLGTRIGVRALALVEAEVFAMGRDSRTRRSRIVSPRTDSPGPLLGGSPRWIRKQREGQGRGMTSFRGGEVIP